MKEKKFFSLRYKIMLAFFGIGVALSLSLGGSSHYLVEEHMFQQLRRNVGNMAVLGAVMIDRQAMITLAGMQKEDPSPAMIESVENSPEYRLVSDQLNFIRDTDKDLIRYVYIMAPTGDPRIMKFIVDADVLAHKKKNAPGVISHFNLESDVTDFPMLQKAMQNRVAAVEETFIYEKVYKINALSGYAPIMAADGKTFLGLLGIDMSDKDVQAALAGVHWLLLSVSMLALAASLLVAVSLGNLLTRSVVRLDTLVRSFAGKNFNVRWDTVSNDEVGRLGQSFNHMAGTIADYNTHLEALLHSYGRFVPHDFLRLLEKESILDVHLGDQIQKEMSVLFSDIRNFTSISETMSPKDNFDFINSYLSRLGPRIRHHNGIIDKYIGDAVMALFPEKAEDAVDAALEMQKIVREYNSLHRKSFLPLIQIGIGIHAGKVALGTIGEEQRMDGTVISDAVNLASRIEGLTKVYGCNIIISSTVLDSLSDSGRYFTRLIDKVRPLGKSEPVILYEVCDADETPTKRLKEKTFQEYSRGIKCFYARDFSSAESQFAKVLAVNNDDALASMFLQRTRNLLTGSVPADWDGISDFDRKC